MTAEARLLFGGMKYGFFLIAVAGALVFAVQVLKRLPSDRFTEAAAVTPEDQLANEAREHLRKRLGEEVRLAKSSHQVMNDGTLIVTRTCSTRTARTCAGSSVTVRRRGNCSW